MFLLKLFFVVFEMILFPMAIGMVWDRKDEYGIARCYVSGYIYMFSLFYLCAAPLVYLHRPFELLVIIWRNMTFLGFLILICILLIEKRLRAKLVHFSTNIKNAFVQLKPMLLFSAVYILVAILFVKASTLDETPETALAAINTGEMYMHNVYTGVRSTILLEGALSPIEMWYAVISQIAGVPVSILLHLLSPIPLLSLYICVGWIIGATCFCQNIQRTKLFCYLWIIFSTCSLIAQRHLAFGIMQNPWSGMTIGGSTLIPILWLQIYIVLSDKKYRTMEAGLFLICTMISLQLVISKGIILAILMGMGCSASFIICDYFIKRKRNA